MGQWLVHNSVINVNAIYALNQMAFNSTIIEVLRSRTSVKNCHCENVESLKIIDVLPEHGFQHL